MIEQNYSWSYPLIQQGAVATNCSLGLFVLIPKFCLWLVSLSENRNLLFPFSAILSLYTILKNAFRTHKNAAVQCLLIKARAYVHTRKFFLWRASLYDHQPLPWTVRPPFSSHFKKYCALITVLIFAQDLSACCQMLGGNASFPGFGLLNIKIKYAGLVRSFLQMRRNLGFSKTKS